MTLNEKYLQLKNEIRSIAMNCHRNLEDIKLVVVSKKHPWNEISEIYNEGCRDFGENRLQEALPKIKEAASPNVNWHYIGTFQKNKVSKMIGIFALIHSVDSYDLAKKISDVSQEKQRVTNILIQVNTSGELSKHGLDPDDLMRNFEKFKALANVEIQGLMTMAPLESSHEVIRNCFSCLRILRDDLGLKHLSMGMSQDYQIAIQEGATILRIGNYLFN